MIPNVFHGALAAIALAAGLLPLATQAETLVVYSARNEQLIKPVFDAYTRETGIEVKFATGDAAVLIERLAAEGRNSPADLLMTVDAGELWNAAERGLLHPVEVRRCWSATSRRTCATRDDAGSACRCAPAPSSSTRSASIRSS